MVSALSHHCHPPLPAPTPNSPPAYHCTYAADLRVSCLPWADRLQSLLAVLERRGGEKRGEGRGERLEAGQGARGCLDKEALSYGLGPLWTQPPGAGLWESFRDGTQSLHVSPRGHLAAQFGA